MERATTSPEIGQRLDHMPVTRLHCLAIVLCALGFTFDLLEISLGSALSAVFSGGPLAAKPAALSLLLSSVYLGAIVGAPAAGWLADRFGRRIMLVSVLLLMATASLAGAASSGVGELTVWRAVGGLALGGFPPLMIAYLTDILPAGRRGALIFVTVAIGSLGPAAGIFLIRALVLEQPLGIEAWRWGFIAGGIGAGVVGLLCLLLPESPRWLQARQRPRDADRVCRQLERSPMVLSMLAPQPIGQADVMVAGWRRWLLVAALFFLSPWATVAFPLLMGAILSQQGFRLTDTLLYVGLSSFGPLVGTLVSSLVIDRIGRRAALTGCATMMLACGALFVSTGAPAWLIAGSFGFGLFAILFVSVLNLYASELFPTRTRATSIAAAWSFNRAGAACAPFVLLPLLSYAGSQAMFVLIGATLLASVALLAVAPPGPAGGSIG